jgi:molybdate transport system substrate-binding protein
MRGLIPLFLSEYNGIVMQNLALLFAVLVAFVVPFSAQATDSAWVIVESGDVTVYAAASLTNALQDIEKAYEASGGAPVKFSFAASSLLAKQIELGAPAEMFFSADSEWMDYLAARNLIQPTTRKDFLSNHLVLIAGQDSMTKLEIKPGFPLAKALGDGRLAIADPNSVPAGKYAQAALTALGVWDSVVDHLARAENVRVALAYVAKGEAPLGIVYETDAKSEPAVKITGVFPENTHPKIVYPGALTRHGTSAGAKAFFDFVKSAQAAEIFQKYGFIVLH